MDLNFEKLNPDDGFGVTRDLFGDMKTLPSPVASAPAQVEAVAATDRRGTVFDAARHKVDEAGNPLKGSKGQFLLKPEAKKTIFQRVADGVQDAFGGKAEKHENSDSSKGNTEKIRDFPRSDHVIEAEREQADQEKSQKAAEQTAVADEAKENAENMADTYFLVASGLLGPDILNQHGKYFPRVRDTFFQYEIKTGRSVKLPAEIVLGAGLMRLTVAMAADEPTCKEKLDDGVATVRRNIGGYIKAFLPGGGKSEEISEPETEKPEVVA